MSHSVRWDVLRIYAIGVAVMLGGGWLFIKLTDNPNCKNVEVREVTQLQVTKYGNYPLTQKYRVCLDGQ